MTTPKLKRGRPLKGRTSLLKRIGFRIPDDVIEEVEIICKEQGIRKTDFILRAIESQIQKERTESNPILERYAQWKEESIKGEN